jgi:membrane protein required for colicin V production
MNLLDMLIIVTIIFLLGRGFFRGFFREIGSLAGVILGIFIGNKFQPEMTSYLKTYLPSVEYLPLISFVFIFVMVLIIFNLVGFGFGFMMKKIFLGWVDKLLGASIALFKGIILTYLVIVLMTFFVPSKTPLIAKSKLAPIIVSSYQSMVGLISPDAYQRWKDKLLKNKNVKEILSGQTSGPKGKK